MEDPEDHYLATLYRELALALGNAIWAFARIEWVITKGLSRLSECHVLGELVSEVDFGKRADMLKALVNQSDKDNVRKKEAKDAIEQAKQLSGKRNIIAHNPWQIWIDMDVDANDFMTEIQKYANKNSRVTLETLTEFIAECDVTEERLTVALGALNSTL